MLITCSSQSEWCTQILERCTNEPQDFVPNPTSRPGEEIQSGGETIRTVVSNYNNKIIIIIIDRWAWMDIKE